MGQRRDRLDRRLARAKITRQKNSPGKQAERRRRDALMLKLLASSKGPYTPAMMNWLSDRLSKKAGQIEEADIQTLLKKG